MNRKKFLFYGRLWGITVGGALVAGLLLALITWLNRGGDVRRMIWYMLAVDCMMTGIFPASDSSFFHRYVHGSVDVGLRLPKKGSYLKFPDSEIFKFSGDSGGHSNFPSSAVSDERKSGGNPAYEGYVSDERSASPLRRLRRKSDRCSL